MNKLILIFLSLFFLGIGFAEATTPTLSFSINRTSINSEQSVTLSWSTTNVNHACFTSGDWWVSGNNVKAPSGSEVVTPGRLEPVGTIQTSLKTYTYGMECFTSTGISTGRKTVSVTVNPPRLTISASPSIIRPGDPITVNWSSTNNSHYCWVTRDVGPTWNWTTVGSTDPARRKSASGSQVVYQYNWAVPRQAVISLECVNLVGISTGDKVVVVGIDPYKCIGTIPTNADLCPGDLDNLTQDTNISLVSSCTAVKCEYTCKSGYVKSGTSCVPACSASCGPWSSWSACSATTCGTSGTQTRTQSCTRADCSTYTNTDTQTCHAPACCVNTSWSPAPSTVCSGTSFTQTGSPCGGTRPATGTMNPGCGNASSYCVGDGYNNGCYWCSGTKTDTSWSPAPSTVCSGVSFTQYGNNGCSTKIATGTKICSGYCNTASNGGYYCDGNTRRWFSAWCSAYCSSGSCGCWWSYSCNPQSTNCGTNSCNDGAGAPEHEYCQGGNVWSKYDGNLRGCAGTSCYNNHTYCSHYEKEVCETGYTCKQIDADNAECVPKISTWTEN